MSVSNKIERRLAKLDALEAGGVDNWEWYDESLEGWFAENELEEKADSLIESICEALSVGTYEPSGRGAGFAFNEESIKDARDLILSSMKELRGKS